MTIKQDDAHGPYEYKIYMADTDYGKVAYFANYLKYAEMAKTDFFEDIGFDEVEWDSHSSTGFMISKCQAEYKKPLTYRDTAAVEITIIEIGKAILTLEAVILNKVTAAISARVEMQLVCVDTKTYRPKRIPGELIDIFQRANP